MTAPACEYALEVRGAVLVARIALNGCTVFRAFEPRLYAGVTRLNPWCLPGRNTLEVLLAEAPDPPADEEPFFAFSLYKLEPPSRPLGAPSALLAYMWTDNEAAAARAGEAATVVYRHTFHIEQRYGDWCWLRADRYRPEHRQAVLDTVERLHRALTDRDTGAVLGMLAVRRAEIGGALGRSVENDELSESAFFERFFEEEDWALEPFDPHALRLEPEADGRLVRVTTASGGLPFSGRAGGRPFALDVTLSRVEGAWVIVR